MTMMMTITNKPLDCFCVITIDDCVRQKAFVSLSAKDFFVLFRLKSHRIAIVTIYQFDCVLQLLCSSYE